jgi:hypothetical protein
VVVVVDVGRATPRKRGAPPGSGSRRADHRGLPGVSGARFASERLAGET